ncbi:hypothetical protein [Bradyrhizobium sp. LVM 105]|uniref:hypothetical protein n=1 Tax=Bradyrhizobium sp. LVM 105 TaxID=2341115 RepID=UPI000F7FAC48|nr:hypothetical protein [Bradyrhizobium sp. LVM 105]RTE91924.1 hypothetical protein D6B98_16045 [Bradyrhizobium sp. LVM 105]
MSFGKLGAMGRGMGHLGSLGSVGYRFVNPEAAAIAAAFSPAPTNARKALIDNLVGGLKSAGIWSALDLFYVTAAAASQNGRVNWKNPGTFDLIEVSSPTFAADQGYTGNGSSSYLRTQYTPSTNGVNFTLNSASAWAWSRTNLASAGADLGNATAPRAFLTGRNGSDQLQGDMNNAAASSISTANTNSIGFYGVQRRGSADRRLFLNGAQVGTASGVVSTSVPSVEQWVCAANATSFGTRQISVAAWGASLSGLESSFYNAVLTYMQAIGAS